MVARIHTPQPPNSHHREVAPQDLRQRLLNVTTACAMREVMMDHLTRHLFATGFVELKQRSLPATELLVETPLNVLIHLH